MKEIRSLTSPRGIFALMIVAYHGLEIGGHIYVPALSYGVAGFFGLSGFLLYSIYSNNLKAKKYIVRRVFRILPLFIFSVLLFYGNVLLKFTPLWSLYTEEMFYFIALPLIVRFKPSTKLLLSLGIISEVMRVVFFVIPAGYAQSGLNNGNLWMIYTLLPFQFLPFAIGIVIARKTKGMTVKSWMKKIDSLLGNRIFQYLGTISFGVYLFHVPMFGWFGPWVGTVATIALATATYFLFEKACIEFAHDKTQDLEIK